MAMVSGPRRIANPARSSGPTDIGMACRVAERVHLPLVLDLMLRTLVPCAD